MLVALGGVHAGCSIRDGAMPPVEWLTLCLWGGGSGLISLAWLRPAWLAVPNRGWHRLGLLLARVVNPVILLLLYVTCIVPIGVVMRTFGHDPLRLKRDTAATTYWVAHEPSPLERPMQHLF